MLQQFLNHIGRNSLCSRNERILVAASGGIDSMVLLNLLSQGGFDIGVAHCNFQLRGPESDKDEALVRKTCEHADIPFHNIQFDTEEYAWAKGLSVQVAARNLRYDFFNALLQQHGYHCIATAHHLNDSIETVLLNLSRGTGVDGLIGIPEKNGNVIRPLLAFTRDQIRDYAIRELLEWREDESNFSDHYTRNVIRHQVIPVLYSINPDFVSNFADTLERVKGMRELSHAELTNFRNTSISSRGEKTMISKAGLRKYPSPAVVLWEILKSFGFHFHECREIVREHQAGKIFKSKTHCLLVDREAFILSVEQEDTRLMTQIAAHESEVITGREALLLRKEVMGQIIFNGDTNVAHLDLSKLSFPLTWRTWQAGDSFSPLGMTTHKKLSDFLVDLKVPRLDKNSVTVLESAGQIVWVVGFRISETVKITPQTTEILRVEWRQDVSNEN